MIAKTVIAAVILAGVYTGGYYHGTVDSVFPLKIGMTPNCLLLPLPLPPMPNRLYIPNHRFMQKVSDAGQQG